jgi:hypothetical protein
MVRRSMPRLVALTGQNTSSQGVPDSSAALIVGDHKHVTIESELIVPSLNDCLSLGARNSVGGSLLGARLDVESPRYVGASRPVARA